MSAVQTEAPKPSVLDELIASEAPLAERLTALASAFRSQNREFAEAVDRAVETLDRLRDDSTVVGIGEALPAFCLSNEKGEYVSLADLLAKGPLVVTFRRGHWCPYCVLATNALGRIQKRLAQMGTNMVVISPERPEFSRALMKKADARVSFLFDMDNGYALSVGLAIAVGQELRTLMSAPGFGIPLGLYQGNDAWVLPIPATFVLDRDGKIVFRHVDADFRHRAGEEDIIRAVTGLTRAKKSR